MWSGEVGGGGADKQEACLEQRLQVRFPAHFSLKFTLMARALQLLLDDIKLLGWLKCADCANAAKKARK